MQFIQFSFRDLLKDRKEFHHYTYIFGLAMLGASLPLSKYLLSVFLFLLILNWLLEGNFKQKIFEVLHRKSTLVLGSILLVYLAGLLYSGNHTEGWKRTLNFLPMFAFTIIMGTVRPATKKELKFILLTYTGAVLVSSIISFGNFFGWFSKNVISDIREISVFIPHLYLSLMVNMAIIILLYFLFFGYFNTSVRLKLIFFCILAWLIFFVFFLKSFMGITIFIVVFVGFLVILLSKLPSGRIKGIIISCLIFLMLAVVGLVGYSLIRYYQVDNNELQNLRSYTVNGNPYAHLPESEQIENGHYVWLNICEKEMMKEWERLSHYSYYGLDKKGQEIRYTLIRYLTSKGLTKDSAGIRQLSACDIDLIENGYTNFIFRNKYGIYQRIYQIIWELDMYTKTGETSSHSVTQRIVFFKHSWKLFKKNWVMGVGTGDIKSSMILQNRLENTEIQKEWEGKPHNQYLNFAASFGILGFCWIFGALIGAVFLEKKQRVLLFNFFLIIYLISMLIIDTMDAHVGIFFFAFFYTLFLYFWQTDEVVVQC